MNNKIIDLLNELYNQIFPENKRIDLFIKRNMIFDFLIKNLTFDQELYEQIKLGKLVRNPTTEILNLLINKTGVASAISYVYKMLLEKAGIYSICLICDDLTEVPHQLNLVKIGNSYSFDDITSVIAGKGEKNKYFNYDLEDAHNNGQGLNEIVQNKKFIGFNSSVIYSFFELEEIGINFNYIKDPNLIDNSFSSVELPNNIERYNNSDKTNVLPMYKSK